MGDITKKFEDFKKKKDNKFSKENEFEPMSNDIIALGKLDNGEYEPIKGPVEIVSIVDVITDPDEIKKIEENFTIDTTLNVGEVKRGDIIWISAMLKKKDASAAWNSQTLSVLKLRLIDYFYGLNKLRSVKKL
jgi:hypothetical protein